MRLRRGGVTGIVLALQCGIRLLEPLELGRHLLELGGLLRLRRFANFGLSSRPRFLYHCRWCRLATPAFDPARPVLRGTAGRTSPYWGLGALENDKVAIALLGSLRHLWVPLSTVMVGEEVPRR